MKQKPAGRPSSSEQIIRDIRRKTRNFKRTLCRIVPNRNIERIMFLEKLHKYLKLLVPEAGLEPARFFNQRILSP